MEEDVIHTAAENLTALGGIKTTWKEGGRNYDGKLTLTFNGQKLTFFTEVKKEVRPHLLPQLAAAAHQHPPFLVVGVTIAPAAKKALQEEGINWLEANGNIWVKEGGIFIWLNTQKPQPLTEKGGNRAYTKTGLKLVFLFLLNDTFLNLPYRQLAAVTGTGIGNITNILKGLKDDGFLLQMNKTEHRLQNKRELLNKWIAAYEAKLKPALKIGTFRFLKGEDFLGWKNLPLGEGTVWGGEPAGELYTHYLRPAILTLYTTGTRAELVKHYRLVPDPAGNVEVYKKFWTEGETKKEIVPPILAYADLVSRDDRRCRETAQKIYDEYLQDRL